jgi:hypothetical protein
MPWGQIAQGFGSNGAKYSQKWFGSTALSLTFVFAGCASNAVQNRYEGMSANLTRPSVVLVYVFHVPAETITKDLSLIAKGINAFGTDTPEARQAELGCEVQERMAQDVVDGINALGVPAQLGHPSVAAPPGALLVQGRFTNVNGGNRLRRSIIGFGAGQSTVDTDVTLSQVASNGPTTLLTFATHANSGAMPGALHTGGADATGASTGALIGTNAGLALIKGYRSRVERLASRGADQAVAHLSDYFANQGWLE